MTSRLAPDRFFDSDPAQRRVARALYEETAALPLICPHGHVDPALLAENRPFPEPTALLITPDHYIFRMLYSRGVSMESLGIPTRDGTAVETDPRRIWQLFADHYYLFLGTPTGAWLEHELGDVFGIETPLSGDTAQRVYDEISERLTSPEYLPRALFERFRIELLATTDAATDSLAHHQAMRDSGWSGRVVPTFRPDALFRISLPGWTDELAALELAVGHTIATYDEFRTALAKRRAFFKSLGATATDHAVVEPYTEWLEPAAMDALFQRACSGLVTAQDQRAFEAHLLIEMARMSVDDGLVMQLHPGSLRDHNARIHARFGTDKGADIPVATEYTRNLRGLLERHGNDSRLTLILFTLDESTYARELAPLAGHYPALRLGPPWWFHDSIQGMIRFRENVTETAGLWNTAGFNDDTRAFCSIPARHDLNRRVDANWLAGLVSKHIVSMDDARVMAHAAAYGLVRETYRLDRVSPNARTVVGGGVR
jgi:glucuronate isomerase